MKDYTTHIERVTTQQVVTMAKILCNYNGDNRKAWSDYLWSVEAMLNAGRKHFSETLEERHRRK